MAPLPLNPSPPRRTTQPGSQKAASPAMKISPAKIAALPKTTAPSQPYSPPKTIGSSQIKSANPGTPKNYSPPK